MAIEVEQKFRLADSAALLGALAALGAQQGRTDHQVDSYFNHPARDFAASDEALRLRRVGPHNYVTYKGPRLDTTTKTRREIELGLPDGEAASHDAARLLELLSFRPVADVCKRRDHFTLTWQGREISVALDHVEGLGDFVELEILADERDAAEAGLVVAALAERLNLSNSERRSYLELLLATADHARPADRGG